METQAILLEVTLLEDILLVAILLRVLKNPYANTGYDPWLATNRILWLKCVKAITTVPKQTSTRTEITATQDIEIQASTTLATETQATVLPK
jgi:predicted DCC family thiol-disulfide oxidoreductase YuxK